MARHRKHGGAAWLGLALVAGCSTNEQAKGPAAPTASVSASAGAPAEAAFTWRASASGPDGAALAPPQEAAEGSLAVKVPGVRCEYGVDPAEPCDGGTCQFGKLWCVEGEHAVQTRTLCQVTPKKPSDTGSSNIRVVAGGTSQQAELSCASPGSDFHDRPRVRVPSRVGAAGPAGSAASSAAGTASSPAPAAPTAIASAVPAVGERIATWKLEVTDGDGKVAGSVDTSSPRGPIAGVPAGWQCAYEILPTSGAGFRGAELGIVSCRRAEGATFETTVVCAIPEDEGATYGQRNVGSLDLSNDGSRSDATLMLQCRVNAGG